MQISCLKIFSLSLVQMRLCLDNHNFFIAAEHIQMMKCCAPDVCRKTRLVTVPRFGFFQDSLVRIRAPGFLLDLSL